MCRPVNTSDRIRAALEVLQPESIEVRDDSAQHAGHAGARDGGGHYHVLIVSPRFRGASRIARHRMVYATLSGMIGRDIHALAIEAYAPDEI